MRTKEDILKHLEAEKEYLAAEYGVEKIGLFGSYAAGNAEEGSDIDLVVSFSRPIGFRFVHLALYLEKLLGVSVDILTPAGVEGIRVPRVAQEIQKSVAYV